MAIAGAFMFHKHIFLINIFSTQSGASTTLNNIERSPQKTLLERDKNAGNHYFFSLFHNVFYTIGVKFSHFKHILIAVFKFFRVGNISTFVLWYRVKPFPKQLILDSSKLKEFTDNNFKFDENGRKIFKMVENTVG